MPTRPGCSSIGRKIVMALTGLGLLGFVVGHLAGNLLIFAGPDAINSYAQHVKSMPMLLWTARIGLLAVLGTHVVTAFRLAIDNRRARSGPYAVSLVNRASLPSLMMLASGLVILGYVAFHLAHFTTGQVGDPAYFTVHDAANDRHDVYAMVVGSFADPTYGLAYTALYMVAMIGLAFHLAHACTSVLQTFGIEHRRVKELALAVALALAAGYLAIPLAVRLGCLPLPSMGPKS